MLNVYQSRDSEAVHILMGHYFQFRKRDNGLMKMMMDMTNERTVDQEEAIKAEKECILC